MGQKSSIRQLPDDLKEQLDAMIRDGRATIDEITAHLNGQGAEVSRSAVGRFKKSMEARLERYREAQAVAGVWLKEVDLGSSDVGRLVAEMLKTVAFRTLADMGDSEAGAEPEEIMLLAKAIKDLEGAAKTNTENRAKIKAELRAEMAEKAAQAAESVKSTMARAGLSEQAAAEIRAQILGVVA